MGKADLHIHTIASDGRLKPEEAVALAKDNGLETISITDHDTIKSYAPAREAGLREGIEVLPGVELTCDFKGRESHLLAYCFDVDAPEMRALLARHRKSRLDRAGWIVQQLRNQGLDLDQDEVKAEAGGANVGRPHIAAVLVNKGYVASFKEAFIRYLGNHVLGQIKNNYVPYHEAIQTVKEAGGALSLAHPASHYSSSELNQWVEAGLDGIEVIHPSHNYEKQKGYRDFADRHNLLVTGGSDYHGNGKNYLRYFGVVTISMSWVEKLKRMTNQRKNISV